MATANEDLRFAFGKNWQDFLKTVDEKRLKVAQESLCEFLNLRDLKSKTFVDVGCGSGIFSYAAFKLGASKIVSFDLDQFSVQCCRYMHERAGKSPNWTIRQGSVLDKDFISQLGKFDIVYSWGVLHHTGQMWQAIEDSVQLVKENGYFYVTLYNKVEGFLGSEAWLKIKKLYNASPQAGKTILESIYFTNFFIKSILSLKNPVQYINNYRLNRGMNFWTDIRDWLGGYPYEFATIEEVFKFMKSKFPAFQLINIKSYNNLACNSYLFKYIQNQG